MAPERTRHLRVAAELERLLNELLQFEAKDPRLSGVRVSHVELSRDLGVARVYYSLLSPDGDPEPVDESLQTAQAFFRSRVGKQLRLRRVPELRFEHDRSALEGLRISQLIDKTGDGD